MNKLKKLINCLLIGSLLLVSGCHKMENRGDESTITPESYEQTRVSPTFSWPDTQTDVWSNYQWTDSETVPVEGDDVDDYYENSTFTSTVQITYSETTATVDDPDNKVTATIDGAHVLINCPNKNVQFVLSGNSSNGSVKFYTSNKFLVTFNGLTLTNPTGPAFNNQSKKRTFLHIADGTQNTLSDGSSYTDSGLDEDMKACLFSEAQLIFSGRGLLTVNAAYKHGICSDDYIRIRPFTHLVVSGAAGDGIHINDYVRIDGGKVAINTTKDGIEAEGVTDDETGETSGGDILINGGTIDITTSAEKGHPLKAEGTLVMNGGLVTVAASGAAAKGMNVAGDVRILGGKFEAEVKGTSIYEEDENDISSAACIKCDGNLLIAESGVYLTATGQGGKGINVDGTLTVNSGRVEITTTGKQYVYQNLDTSPKAMKAEGDLTINGGVIIISATGGEGSEGVESKSKVYINGGAVQIDTYDDSINATNLIQISGGFVYACSTGNDAIDSGTDDSGSQGLLTISGGFVYAIGTNSPEGGFDNDNHTFTITGGTLIGLGGASSIPTSSVCTQNAVVCGIGAVSGQSLCLRSASGDNLFVMQVPTLKALQSQVVLLYSAPQFASGTTYSLYTGGTASGASSFHGFYSAGSYNGGTVQTTFSVTNRVTSINSGSPGGGGMPGGGGFGWK